jgi:hypothetical protein
MRINPVWYIDKTWARPWELGLALDELRKAAVKDGFTSASAKLLPFIEPMFDWRSVPGKTQVKEFWWEREWRHRGDLSFSLTDVALVIAPAADHPDLEAIVGSRVVDGTWGLERIIAKLAGVPTAEQATPVAAR